MIFTVAQIQAQNQVFAQKVASHEITPQQYNQAMTYQRQAMQEAQLREAGRSTPPSTGPLGPQPGSPQYAVQGNFVQKGSTVIPITTRDPNTPLVKTVVGYTVIPPKTSQPAPTQKQPASVSPLPSAYWETPSGEKAPTGYTSFTVDERAQLSKLETIGKENQRFIEAQKKGEISGAKYNTAIMAQYERTIALEPTIPKGMIVTGVNYQVGKASLALSPLMIHRAGSHFGSFDPNVAGYGMKGEPIPFIPAPPGAPKGLDYSESRALMGMTLVTSVAIPFGAGTLAKGAFIVGAGGAVTGGAEAVKYGTTKQHLTPEEAISTFAIGEIVGVGLLALNTKVIQPRATEYVSKSYEKTLGTEDLWQPSIKQQVLMKITGAKPNSLTLQGKATDLLTTSYDKQMRLNQELIETDGYRNVPFGTEPSLEVKAAIGQMDWQGSPWIASIKEREIMSLVGVRPKPLPTSFVSAGFINEEFMSYKGLQARAYASASFDFSASPKSSLIMVNKTPVEMVSIVAKDRLAVLFGLGSPYKTGYGEKAVLTDFKDVPYLKGRDLPLEKGIPENQLAYDYRGPLSFRKEMFEPIINAVPKRGGTKPLWDSAGSKASEEVIFPSRPINQLAIQQERTSVTGDAIPKGVFADVSQVVKTSTEPFLGFAGETQATVKATNPFLGYKGKSYFAQRNRQEEDYEVTYTNYPSSGLAQPVSPAQLRTSIKQSLSGVGVVGVSGRGQRSELLPSSIFNIGETLIAPDKSPPERMFNTVFAKRGRQGQRGRQDFFPIGSQKTILDLTPRYDIMQKQEQTPFAIQELVSILDVVPIFDVPQIQDQPQPQIPKQDQPQPQIPRGDNLFNLGFRLPEGFRLREGGGFGVSFGKRQGLSSRRRVYPILTGKEVLKRSLKMGILKRHARTPIKRKTGRQRR